MSARSYGDLFYRILAQQGEKSHIGFGQFDHFELNIMSGRLSRLLSNVCQSHKGYFDHLPGRVVNLFCQLLDLRPLLVIRRRTSCEPPVVA